MRALWDEAKVLQRKMGRMAEGTMLGTPHSLPGLACRIRNDAVVRSQGDAAPRVLTLRGLEHSVGKLRICRARKDTLDSISTAVAP